MSYHDNEDGTYTCDGCGAEMTHEDYPDSTDIFCLTEGCPYEGRHYPVWVSRDSVEYEKADEAIHQC